MPILAKVDTGEPHFLMTQAQTCTNVHQSGVKFKKKCKDKE